MSDFMREVFDTLHDIHNGTHPVTVLTGITDLDQLGGTTDD